MSRFFQHLTPIDTAIFVSMAVVIGLAGCTCLCLMIKDCITDLRRPRSSEGQAQEETTIEEHMGSDNDNHYQINPAHSWHPFL